MIYVVPDFKIIQNKKPPEKSGGCNNYTIRVMVFYFD
jgi:hypothetical protein